MQGVTVLNESSQCNITTPGSGFTCSSDLSTCSPLKLSFSEIGDYIICLDEIHHGCDTESTDLCTTVQVTGGNISSSCLGSTIFNAGSTCFENTDGPITEEFSFQIDDCNEVCFSLDFSTNGQAWDGNGNLEAAEECLNCAGDPLNSLLDGCDFCWDFLYARFFIGDNLVYEELLGDSVLDELDGTWSVVVDMNNYPVITEGSIIIIGQTFAANENLSFSNLVVNCINAANAVDNDGDGFDNTVDCNDFDPNINPSATEICDNIDNNCNGLIDEGLAVNYFADNDGDGFGDPFNSILSCTGQVGFVLDNTDCDDTNADVNPAAIEIPFNGIDDNCDGIMNTEDPCLDATQLCDVNTLDGLQGSSPYQSFNGEIIGLFCNGFVLNNPVYYEFVSPVENLSFNLAVSNCAIGSGLQAAIIDPCDEGTCFTTFGGACVEASAEIDAVGLTIGNTYQLVIDGCAGDSCTYLIELITNIGSQGSLQTYYLDADGDGFGDPNISVQDCMAPAGYSLNNTDCDDNNAAINEGAIEIPNNGIDENCDGIDDVQGSDSDGDGFFADDCDDTNPNINPGAAEVCDGIDNNCDGQIDEGFVLETYYSDGDMDGYGVGAGFTDCLQPPDTSTQGGDCDDTNPDINPGATEIPNNTIDEDCDGEAVIIDLDGDGWNSDLDCDDTNAAINPAATEVGGNGIDEDCDGVDGPSSFHQIDGYSIQLYPNPVTDLLHVKTDLTDVYFTVLDLDGKLITQGKCGSAIDMTNLSDGVYVLLIFTENNQERIVERIIKL